MDEAKLDAIAEDIRHQVVAYAGEFGFGRSDFYTRVPAFNTLTETEKEWVLIRLVKMPDIASTFTPRGALRLFAERRAAPYTFNVNRSREAA